MTDSDMIYWPYAQDPEELFEKVGELERKCAGQHAALVRQQDEITSLKKSRNKLQLTLADWDKQIDDLKRQLADCRNSNGRLP